MIRGLGASRVILGRGWPLKAAEGHGLFGVCHGPDHGALTKQILACFYEVHHELGYGFPEVVYSRAMEIALSDAGLACEREVILNVEFRDRIVGVFRADTVVESLVILEYKASERSADVGEGQLLSYLNATDKEVGLLLKFLPKPTFKRYFMSNELKKSRRLPFVPRPSASRG